MSGTFLPKRLECHILIWARPFPTGDIIHTANHTAKAYDAVFKVVVFGGLFITLIFWTLKIFNTHFGFFVLKNFSITNISLKILIVRSITVKNVVPLLCVQPLRINVFLIIFRSSCSPWNHLNLRFSRILKILRLSVSENNHFFELSR